MITSMEKIWLFTYWNSFPFILPIRAVCVILVVCDSWMEGNQVGLLVMMRVKESVEQTLLSMSVSLLIWNELCFEWSLIGCVDDYLLSLRCIHSIACLNQFLSYPLFPQRNRKASKEMPLPWFEHGLSRPQRDVLTNYTTVALVHGPWLVSMRLCMVIVYQSVFSLSMIIYQWTGHQWVVFQWQLMTS